MKAGKILAFWIVGILLTGCATQTMPGQTLGHPILQRDTWSLMQAIDSAEDTKCKDRKVVNTEVTEKPRDVRFERERMLQGWWEERWTVDRCGKLVPYRVRYTADGKGGTYFTVGLER